MKRIASFGGLLDPLAHIIRIEPTVDARSSLTGRDWTNWGPTWNGTVALGHTTRRKASDEPRIPYWNAL